jgi:hypothetical protein
VIGLDRSLLRAFPRHLDILRWRLEAELLIALIERTF